jgi:hypothetical protein
MGDEDLELCRHCGEPITWVNDRWAHGRHGFGGWGTVGCRSYSFTRRGEWDDRLTRWEKAQPRTKGQLAGREEFPAWPGLQEKRREAERKEREAEALAATRFSPQLTKAVKAAQAVVLDPGSSTFRVLERRRQAVCLAIERQARRVAAQRGHAEFGSITVNDELSWLLQLTKELFRSLREAEELLPPAEAVKAAASALTGNDQRLVRWPGAARSVT